MYSNQELCHILSLVSPLGCSSQASTKPLANSPLASSIFKKQVVVELVLNCWLTNLYNCQKTPVEKYYSRPYKPTTILKTKAADFSKKLGSVERPCRPRSCCDVCTAFPVSPARSLCTENKFLQFRMRNFPGS